MDAPAVTITPEAAAWVREKGSVLTLRRTPRHGCCGGRVTLPVAEVGAPLEEAGFAHHDLGDITLFIEPGVDGPLHVALDRLFGLASLYVEGAEAEM